MNSPERIWNQNKYNKYKNWGIVILAALVIFFIFFRKNSSPPIPVIDNSPILEEVKRLTDKNNKMAALVEQYTVTNAQARAYADSLAKALGTKPKYIKGVDQIVYRYDTILKENVEYIPSPNSDTAFYLNHKDEWIDITASSIKGTRQLEIGLTDTLTVIEKVRKPLFGREKRELIVRNASPYYVAQKGYSWTVEERRTWLSIGPYVGLDVLTMKPSVGVSVQIPIIQLKR